jgi:hypothetical protein
MTGQDANDLIDRILSQVNQAEATHSPYDFMEIRRLLNNDLRQAVEELELKWDRSCLTPMASVTV